MAWMSDWSSGPPGLLDGRMGACVGKMHTAATVDVSHDPATDGIPAGSQAAGTPEPVRLVPAAQRFSLLPLRTHRPSAHE